MELKRVSASTETTHPAPRMSIVADPTPAAPWTGVKFTCEKCQAVFQLEAADACESIDPGIERYFRTPACWSCGHVNQIEVPVRNEQEQCPS